jgi:hypothetical protein
MHRLVAVALGGLIAFSGVVAAQGNPVSLEALQAEIARLKERLAQLEAQLAEVQKQQKATENLTQRLQPLTVHGYIQMRYVRDTTQPTDANDLARGSARDTFRLRRVRLDVRGEPLRGVLYRLQLDAAETNTQIKDAYLELKAGDGTFTFGHFKVPLLEEVLESSSARLTPERARVSTELFPGERDRGIAYAWRKKGLPEITAGFFSGTRSTETQDSLTSRKSWLVRLVQPIGNKARLWLGRMDGVGRRNFGTNQNPLLLDFDRERNIVGFLWTPTPSWTMRGEWVKGKDFGNAADPTVDVWGWYLLLGYRLPHSPTIYAKHDQYDPNRDVRFNTFRRNALGVQYDLNKMTRLNLTWEREKNPNATRWTFQTQLRY